MGTNFGRISDGTKLQMRAAMMGGLGAKQAASRFHVSQGAAEFVAIAEMELPKSRCAGCGGLVVMPCRKCFVDGGSR